MSIVSPLKKPLKNKDSKSQNLEKGIAPNEQQK